MDKSRKTELLMRALGLRHKLKVHESMGEPENHEDLAASLVAKWELEDELKSIEELLAEVRNETVATRKMHLRRQGDASGPTTTNGRTNGQSIKKEAVSVKPLKSAAKSAARSASKTSLRQ